MVVCSKMLLYEYGHTVHYAFHNRSLEVDHYQELLFQVWFSSRSCLQQWWQWNETYWRWQKWLAWSSNTWSTIWRLHTFEIALQFCEVHGVDQVLDQELTRPEEQPEEEGEEVAEDKVNFYTMEALEVIKKCMWQFDNKHSIVTLCSRLENELQIDI